MAEARPISDDTKAVIAALGSGSAGGSISTPSTSKWTTLKDATADQVAWYQQQRAAALAAGQEWPEAPPGTITFPNPAYAEPKPAAGSTDTITRPDGSVYRIGPDNKPIPILSAGGKPLGVTTVATNTTDQYIVTVDQTTGEMVPVFNPNYKQPQPGAVTTNSTDQFIVTRSADGTLNTAPNPNYVAPKPGTIATDSSSKFIVQQGADGSVKSIPNPNYVEKTPTTLSGTTDSTSQFILQQQPDGSVKQIPNPNYVPKTPTVVGGDTTSPFIVRQKPDGTIEQIANPNYQPKPTVVTTDTSSPFIVRQQPDGTVSQVPNPNYQQPKPTVVSTGATDQYITTMGPDGKLSSQPNPSFQPKTLAEVQARVGQIQSAMQAKGAEVQAKVGQTIGGKLYTADDALKDYNAWHAQNVDSQAAALQAAQQAAVFQQAKDQAAMRTSASTAATSAGTLAYNAAKEDKSGRVGPGFGDFMNSITAGKGLAGPGADFNKAFTFQAPLAADQSTAAVNNALKYIDPTAAQATGSPMPNYGSVDIGAALAASRYAPNGAPMAPPAPPAPGAGAPAAGAPGGPGSPGFDWNALFARQEQDRQLQQRQAQVMGGGVTPGMPFAGLGAATPDQWSQYIPNYSPGG